MQKIFFNDKYGLTAAVLAGTKTQTRRIVPQKALDAWNDIDDGDEYSRSVYCDTHDAKMRNFLLKYAQYKVGEVVAVAQPYNTTYQFFRQNNDKVCEVMICRFGQFHKGWTNKMFVQAEFMPHQIEITNIRVERLQDISNDDCLAEGIVKYSDGVYTYIEGGKKYYHRELDTPQKAYGVLINKINGLGTWMANPWVFCYTFKLVK